MQQDPVKCLLDESYDGPIELETEEGAIEQFVQIALIPYDGIMYAILVAKKDFDNGDIEAAGIVVSVDEDNNQVLSVKNVNIINEVFEAYDRLFEEM